MCCIIKCILLFCNNLFEVKNVTIRNSFLWGLILVFISCADIKQVNAQVIKIATFNIRADMKGDGVNQWKYRKKVVSKFIRKEKFDIICMQEVINNQLLDILQCDKRFDYIGIGRDDGHEKGEYVPIIYRKDKYMLVRSGTFWLSQTPNRVGGIGWDASYPRIATWAILRIAKTGKEFFIVNTHLDNVGKLARQNGMKLILDTIPVLSENKSVIFTGDFNSNDNSAVYNAVRNNPLMLKDIYKHRLKANGVNYTFHRFGKIEERARTRIDYMFVSKGIMPLVVNIPKPKSDKGIYISDHNPVIAKLKME